MPTLSFLCDEQTGRGYIAGLERLPGTVADDLTSAFGPLEETGCARPLAVQSLPGATEIELSGRAGIRIAGYYHNSLLEGPGRRSCALVQGCGLRCRGCWTPHLHSFADGTIVTAERLAEALLDPAYSRDGVSILGGEPTAQPEGLLALVRALRARGCPHIVLFSGYTLAALRRRSASAPALAAILDSVDMLVDGPFVARLARGAGPWTGSGNQRVLIRDTSATGGFRMAGDGPG